MRRIILPFARSDYLAPAVSAVSQAAFGISQVQVVVG
jgi:hypothetical protein